MVKNPLADAGDVGSIPELGRSPLVGDGNPLQYSCLENPIDREPWQAIVHPVAESDITARMHTQAKYCKGKLRSIVKKEIRECFLI